MKLEENKSRRYLQDSKTVTSDSFDSRLSLPRET